MAVNRVADEALDRIAPALVETRHQMGVDVAFTRDLIDQFDAKESKTEILGDPSPKLRCTRSRQSRQGDTVWPRPCDSPLFLEHPPMNLAADHPVE
jgi:hypothetical protein